ncbi:MAG: deoxyguanosinetriphosphate triphosphohydrolase [Candidatus Aminicenantes bacterium]|nr:deoxyguanosinetriphosphate triphosphohydrolase [Candidatus Aminicenantes bacterium]RLE03152.1 MAG: deoxyguanosinetriphosphate triphosphohydrolase [Candidatus Aminicenantes bacterium]HHF43063.1 deoxyguanosinetriphosphate triphosphohydrolase [Candidatus Aminicenantes bacterium]
MASIREELEAIERNTLSPRACLSSATKGRQRPERPHPLRTEFQRDRDRIIHSKSFRRLKHKTQVFLAPFGDHYRTRLTHTLEVSQIARTIARALRLNEDLTEAIALGHDLGHTPFGHSGEKVLDRLVPGGFHHARQSLRVVEKLEYEGKGLNLTFEVREGIVHHSKGRGEILPDRSEELPQTLEAQVVRVSDVIAYVNHDIDDAIRAGIINEDDIPQELVQILGKWPSQRIDRMVEDVVKNSLKVELARITLSSEIKEALGALRDFLYERVYYNPAAKGELRKTEKILRDLFEYLYSHPDEYIKPYPEGDPLERRVADFIAGMTDRYALGLYERLFFPRSWPG